MVDLLTLLAFVPAAVALNLTPGADMMFCLGQGLRAGPVPAIAASAGIVVGGMVHVTLAGLGLGAAVTDELRDQFNALHQLFLDGSMVVGAPAVAVALYVAATTSGDLPNQSLALLGALGAVMVVSFGVAVALYGVVGAAT